MAATETPRILDQLAERLTEIAGTDGDKHVLVLEAEEAAFLLERLEPPRTPAFEGWADVELMGHRRRVAFVRELELAHRGFLQLTWPDGDKERREIYATSALFSLTPIDTELEALELLHQLNEGIVPW